MTKILVWPLAILLLGAFWAMTVLRPIHAVVQEGAELQSQWVGTTTSREEARGAPEVKSASVAAVAVSQAFEAEVYAPVSADISEANVLELVNRERRKAGVPILMLDPRLQSAAKAKADDMAVKGYFAHVSPEGFAHTFFIEQTGYARKYTGENLATNYATVQEAVAGWMASPTHAENILDRGFVETGVAVTPIGGGLYTIVQLFGREVGD